MAAIWPCYPGKLPVCSNYCSQAFRLCWAGMNSSSWRLIPLRRRTGNPGSGPQCRRKDGFRPTRPGHSPACIGGLFSSRPRTFDALYSAAAGSTRSSGTTRTPGSYFGRILTSTVSCADLPLHGGLRSFSIYADVLRLLRHSPASRATSPALTSPPAIVQADQQSAAPRRSPRPPPCGSPRPGFRLKVTGPRALLLHICLFMKFSGHLVQRPQQGRLPLPGGAPPPELP